MLKNSEINELIRDREAWKRAASQSSPYYDNCSSPPFSCHVPWSMLRRSAGDDAQTARFATSLRSASPQHLRLPSDGFIRDKWSISGVIKQTPMDPLFQLFQKNIQRRGYGVVKKTLAAKQRQTPHHNTASNGINHHDVIILYAWRLIAMEAEERKGILRREREQRSVVNTFYCKASLELLMEAEYVQRKATFQAALSGYRKLLEEESVEFQCATSLSHSAYKRLAILYAREKAARNLIAHEEKQERVVIEKMRCLLSIRSKGRNPVSLTKRENQSLHFLINQIKTL
ncbi:unnamed protein product [Phytomonas sp. Hart1]|nr:unnamed protein product [Phytomonas sp. Hart1]|eukprot:CCW67246.1 unnamed protein product [Phytomonas sp. isolate Hart1]